MDVLDALQTRNCPVCGQPASSAEPFLAARVDAARLNSFTFASRKLPEYMSFRLVRCRECATVFAAEAPRPEALAAAYEAASYDSAEEAVSAARTYAANLARRLAPATLEHGAALENGTGTGVFLRELRALGFRHLIGVEPSTAAIEAAAPDVRDLIHPGVFEADAYTPESFSLVCCFQTLEHVPDPGNLARGAFDLLRPGGQIALVTHDYTATINRLLGRRSPIIDVEHMQLFCPESLRRLLRGAGFDNVEVTTIANAYPLRYWMRLMPLPQRAKPSLLRAIDAVGLGGLSVSVNVGNLLTTATKPLPVAGSA